MKNLTLQLKDFATKSKKTYQYNSMNLFFLKFSLKTRETSLSTLKVLFSQKYLPEQVANRYGNFTHH